MGAVSGPLARQVSAKARAPPNGALAGGLY